MKGAGLLGASLWLLGCTGHVEPDRAEVPLSPLVAQRVTATVARDALRLVRLETERETFLTTPEHPFATPDSGWVSAGRLLPGDSVVSERFGAARLVSTRSEPAARKVPVFNLSVASSHAYFVGTDRVLVHNTQCTPNTFEARQAAIERLIRQRDEISHQIRALAPTSPQLAGLRAERDRLCRQLDHLRRAQRSALGLPPQNRDIREWHKGLVDQEAARQALEEARNELAAFESRSPHSEANPARKAELQRRVSSRQLSFDRANLIMDLMRRLAHLDSTNATTNAEHQAVQGQKQQLRADLIRARKRARVLNHARKKSADPEWRQRKAVYKRALDHSHRRTAAHLADTARPRDQVERLEDELAIRIREPPSESRDTRIQQLTSQLSAQKRLVEIRKEIRVLIQRRYRLKRARARRPQMTASDTSEFDQRLAETTQELRARRNEVARLRRAASGMARERPLEALNASYADGRGAGMTEAHPGNDALSERDELTRSPPSPERDAALQSSYERLLRELGEGRAAVEVALSALANEQAHIQTTRASSSTGPTWQERLRAIEGERAQLRARWRASLEERLRSLQRQLDVRRNVFALRDQAIEAELAREITLLMGELQRLD